MEGLVLIFAILFFAIMIPAVYVMSVYNSTVSYRNSVRESFSDVHVQLKRRADLIPNLVETVKAYAKHEREVLERLTELRTQFEHTRPDDREAVIKNDNMVTQALKTVFAVAENYPDLKASENFKKMQESLEETEDQVASARRIYNSNVNDYNTYTQQFPSNLVARHFAFKEETFFSIPESEQALPRVSFN